MKIRFNKGLRNHSLLIAKEVFLIQNYALTNTTNAKLKSTGGVIVDIGANIGISTAYFKWLYPTSRLVAIEASPINYLILLENINTNGFEVQTINSFVSNSRGSINFHHNLQKPGASFGEGFKSNPLNKSEKFNVQMMKLSDLISGWKSIVVKIDVEGAEFEILKDLASSKNISEVMEIIAEVSTSNQKQLNELNSVINSFYNLGFEPRIISDYSNKMLKTKSNQGHIKLILLRN